MSIAARRVKVIMELERQDELIKWAHEGEPGDNMKAAKSGHWGRDKTMALIQERYLIPMIRERVEDLIRRCFKCQVYRHNSFKAGITLHPVKVPIQAWSQVGVDLIGPLQENCNYRYICTAVDYFTKWVEGYPIVSKKPRDVAEVLHTLLCRYGVMDIQISDQGPEFNTCVSKRFYEITGIQHNITSGYHPQSNGCIERANQTIEGVIRKTMENRSDWKDLLPSVLLACNSSKHKTTGYSPYRAIYSKDPVMPWEHMDAVRNNEGNKPANMEEMSIEESLELMMSTREAIFSNAADNIKKAQARYTRDYNERNKGSPFNVGDKVLKKNPKCIGRLEKFQAPWLGPYTIFCFTGKGKTVMLKDKHSHVLKKAVSVHLLSRYNDPEQTSGSGSPSNAARIGGSTAHSHEPDDSGINSGSETVSVNNSRATADNLDESMFLDDLCEDPQTSHEIPLDMDVNDIPLEIIPDANYQTKQSKSESTKSDHVACVPSDKSTPAANWYHDDTLATEGFMILDMTHSPTYYNPLLQQDRIILCKYVGIRGKLMDIPYVGVGNLCKGNTEDGRHYYIKHRATPNGACYFNSISFLLTGLEKHHLKLRKIICDYISKEENFNRLRSRIDAAFRDGKDYIARVGDTGYGMRHKAEWATDVEVLATAQILCTDVIVYARGVWERFYASGTRDTPSPRALYLVNESGEHHYDPIIGMNNEMAVRP